MLNTSESPGGRGAGRLRRIWILFVILSFIGCDQVTKGIARETLASADPISLAKDTFRFTYAENTGVFLGLGEGLPPSLRFGLFTVIVGVVLILILADTLRRKNDDYGRLFAVTLILAGGFGNLIDRIVNGGVVIDFMNMGIGPLRTGIFNVADVLITTGAAVFLYLELLHARARRSTDVPTVAQ
jgi:signal peptidase II